MKCPKPKIFSVHILDVNFFKRPEGSEGNWKICLLAYLTIRCNSNRMYVREVILQAVLSLLLSRTFISFRPDLISLLAPKPLCSR